MYRKGVIRSTVAVAGISAAVIVLSPLISLLWLGRIELTYTIFCATLAAGVILNAYGASAYNLGMVTGELRWNILVNSTVLFALGAFGVAVGMITPAFGLVTVVAFTMGAGGFAIKVLNERLLRTVGAS